MKLFISLLPEIIFLTGGLLVFLGLIAFANLAVATIFLGGMLLVVSGYVSNIMSVEVE